MRLLAHATVLSLVLAGCVGSTTGYRPYKGEPRPEQERHDDPIRAQVELEHGVPHDVDEDTAYIDETKREQSAALEHVHRNDDGTPRNAWNAYATDMNRTLGPGTVREAPRPQPKSEQMLRRSEQSGEGGGEGGAEKKPAEGGEKPAEKKE